MKRIPSYVLNDFLKFERKIYSVFNVKLGRSLQVKTVMYFLVFFFILLMVRFIPIIGYPIKSLPAAFYLAIPGVLAYLLTDIGTENRSPVSYFKSFVSYQFRSKRSATIYRGKELSKPKTYSFGSALTYKEKEDTSQKHEVQTVAFRGYLTYREFDQEVKHEATN